MPTAVPHPARDTQRRARGRCVVPALAAAMTLLVAADGNATDPPVVSLDEALAAQADSTGGAVVAEILRGRQASVNAWRITDAMPPHLHREHEEIIVVRTGRARARIGERDVDLKPGDVFLVPRNTVHGARAYGEEPCTGVSVFAPAFDGKDRVPFPAPDPDPRTTP